MSNYSDHSPENTQYFKTHDINVLFARINDMKCELQIRLFAVRNFVTIYLNGARDLAKAGLKDEARNWLRFVRNADLIGLLSDEDYGVLSDKEKAHLGDLLRSLERECHPLEEPDFRGDLAVIRWHLEAISKQVGIEPKIAFLPCVVTQQAEAPNHA